MKRILIAALAIASITSCKKEDEAPAELAVTMANMAGTWKITAESVAFAGTTTDIFNSMAYQACERDDVYIFAAAGTVKNEEGIINCVPATSSITMPFTLNTTTKIVGLPPTVASGGYTAGLVKSLTANTMVIEQTTTVAGITYTYAVTLSK